MTLFGEHTCHNVTRLQRRKSRNFSLFLDENRTFFCPFFVHVSAISRRRSTPLAYVVAAAVKPEFCVAFRRDTYVILSRTGGQFASQIAMRYRLAATLFL